MPATGHESVLKLKERTMTHCSPKATLDNFEFWKE
jgi:hypothetical protein